MVCGVIFLVFSNRVATEKCYLFVLNSLNSPSLLLHGRLELSSLYLQSVRLIKVHHRDVKLFFTLNAVHVMSVVVEKHSLEITQRTQFVPLVSKLYRQGDNAGVDKC